MSQPEIPKMGFLQRVKIAFSDKAAVERVLAVTAALNGEKTYDCNPDDVNSHEWDTWRNETWSRTLHAGTENERKVDFNRLVRKCKRCNFPQFKE